MQLAGGPTATYCTSTHTATIGHSVPRVAPQIEPSTTCARVRGLIYPLDLDLLCTVRNSGVVMTHVHWIHSQLFFYNWETLLFAGDSSECLKFVEAPRSSLYAQFGRALAGLLSIYMRVSAAVCTAAHRVTCPCVSFSKIPDSCGAERSNVWFHSGIRHPKKGGREKAWLAGLDWL